MFREMHFSRTLNNFSVKFNNLNRKLMKKSKINLFKVFIVYEIQLNKNNTFSIIKIFKRKLLLEYLIPFTGKKMYLVINSL